MSTDINERCLLDFTLVSEVSQTLMRRVSRGHGIGDIAKGLVTVVVELSHTQGSSSSVAEPTISVSP